MSDVQVKLGRMAAAALAGAADPDPARVSLLLPRAVRFYLGERNSGRAGWRYPGFLAIEARGKEARPLALEEGLWREFEVEAERQDVGGEELLQHAAFYFAAARDEGRLTERIVAEIRREAEEVKKAG